MVDIIVWPFGEGIKFLETELPWLFKGERGDFGIFPYFETGGGTGTSYGALIFNRSFLGSEHDW